MSQQHGSPGSWPVSSYPVRVDSREQNLLNNDLIKFTLILRCAIECILFFFLVHCISSCGRCIDRGWYIGDRWYTAFAAYPYTFLDHIAWSLSRDHPVGLFSLKWILEFSEGLGVDYPNCTRPTARLPFIEPQAMYSQLYAYARVFECLSI